MKRSTLRALVRLSLMAVMSGVFGCDSAGSVDLIIQNARIWTGDSLAPSAEAMLIRDGRIVAVGAPETLRPQGGLFTNSIAIDAGGRRILPGLIDAHLHLVSGGLSLSRVQLGDVRSHMEFVQRIRDEVAKRQPGANDWLIGRGWSTESWPKTDPPLHRGWINFMSGVPIVLYRMDGHCALVNNAALAIAGIDEHGPPDPPGGVIERDPATNSPNGILKDSAIELVEKFIPEPTLDTQCDAVRAAMREANRFGVTTVNAMTEWKEVEAIRRVHDSNDETLRVGIFVMEKNWADYVDRIRQFPVHDDRLWIAGFKAYMDGSLGSRTACMREPFSDRPDSRGLLSDTMQIPGRMAANFRMADAAGLQCAVHAIGDEANHELLDLYAALAKENGARDRRPRIEHAQHLLPEDIERFAGLGVVASMQPFHKADDARYAEAAIGPERSKTSYAFRQLIESGAHVGFGSDWPVVTVNPFAGIATAVTGRTLNGNAWMTHQNISIEQALQGYTVGAAYACRREQDLGRIAPGYLADFVILEDDVLSVPGDAIERVRIHATYIGGRQVWPAAESAAATNATIKG